MRRIHVLALSLILVASAGLAQPPADERHYVLIFGSQGETNLPRFSHTFATFVKATGTGKFPDDYKLDVRTISWMPRSLNIEIARLRTEPGVNLTLQETLRWVRSINGRVRMWGPYVVGPELFELARKQAERLDSGAIAYRAVDFRNRGIDASNCTHAVCDLDRTRSRLVTGASFGNGASTKVVQHFTPWFIASDANHDWLLKRLELDPNEISRAGPSVASRGAAATPAPSTEVASEP